MCYNVKTNVTLNVIDYSPFDYTCACPICGNEISRGTDENYFICDRCGQSLYAPKIFLSENDSTESEDSYLSKAEKVKLKKNIDDVFNHIHEIEKKVNKILEILDKTT